MHSEADTAGQRLQLLLSHQLFTDDSEVIDADTIGSVVEVLNLHRLIETLPAVSPILKKWNAKVLVLLRSTRETDRWIGLCLLGPTARQACAEVFDNNCVQWMSCLLDMYKKKPSDRTQAHPASTFLEILASGVKKPDLRRALSDSHFPRFVQLMLALTRTVSPPSTKTKKGVSVTSTAIANKPASIAMALQSLARCLELQPGPARPFSNQIFAAAVSHLDSLDSRVLSAACTCIAHIPLCGKAGSTPQEQWTVLLTTTTSSMHQVLDTAYAVLDEQSAPPTVASRGTELPLPELSAETITTTHMLAKACQRRFAALCALVKTMLTGNVLSRQNVPTGLLFDVLVRVCDVDRYTPTRYGSDAAYEQLMCHATQYHEAMLSVFQTVCVSLGPQLLPFAARLSYILNQMRKLYLTKGSSYHGSYRVLVLKCYVSAAQCLGPGMDTATTDSMLTAVFRGVKQIAAQTHSADTDTDRADSGQLIRWWVAAMATLATALSRQAAHLSAEKLSDLGAWTCLQLTTYQVHPTLAPSLLTRPECRLSIYKVLRAMALNSRPTHSSYIQQAVRVFQKGMVDPDVSVSEYCYESSLICDWLIHPRLPITQRAVPGSSSNRLIGLSVSDEPSNATDTRDDNHANTYSQTEKDTDLQTSQTTSIATDPDRSTMQTEESMPLSIQAQEQRTSPGASETTQRMQKRVAEDEPTQPVVKQARVQADGRETEESEVSVQKDVSSKIGLTKSESPSNMDQSKQASTTNAGDTVRRPVSSLDVAGTDPALAGTDKSTEKSVESGQRLADIEKETTGNTEMAPEAGRTVVPNVGSNSKIGDMEDDGSDDDDIPDIVDEDPDSE